MEKPPPEAGTTTGETPPAGSPPSVPPAAARTSGDRLWHALTLLSRAGCVGVLLWLGVIMVNFYSELGKPMKEEGDEPSAEPTELGAMLGVPGMAPLSAEGRWLAGAAGIPFEVERIEAGAAERRLEGLWASHADPGAVPAAAMVPSTAPGPWLPAAAGAARPMRWRTNARCRHARGLFGSAEYAACLPVERGEPGGSSSQILAFRRTEDDHGTLYRLEPGPSKPAAAVPVSPYLPGGAQPILTRTDGAGRVEIQLADLGTDLGGLEAHWKAGGIDRQEVGKRDFGLTSFTCTRGPEAASVMVLQADGGTARIALVVPVATKRP